MEVLNILFSFFTGFADCLTSYLGDPRLCRIHRASNADKAKLLALNFSLAYRRRTKGTCLYPTLDQLCERQKARRQVSDC